MDLKKTLHNISHLKWGFLIAQITLIIYCFAALPENLVSIIGIIIFITGIQMGLDSLSDVEKMSAKERKRYSKPNFAKRQSTILLFGIVVLTIISLLFISLKFIFSTSRNAALFNDLFDLGLDCWALILGFLCLIKSIYDKDNYVNAQPQN